MTVQGSVSRFKARVRGSSCSRLAASRLTRGFSPVNHVNASRAIGGGTVWGPSNSRYVTAYPDFSRSGTMRRLADPMGRIAVGRSVRDKDARPAVNGTWADEPWRARQDVRKEIAAGEADPELYDAPSEKPPMPTRFRSTAQRSNVSDSARSRNSTSVRSCRESRPRCRRVTRERGR